MYTLLRSPAHVNYSDFPIPYFACLKAYRAPPSLAPTCGRVTSLSQASVLRRSEAHAFLRDRVVALITHCPMLTCPPSRLRIGKLLIHATTCPPSILLIIDHRAHLWEKFHHVEPRRYRGLVSRPLLLESTPAQHNGSRHIGLCPSCSLSRRLHHRQTPQSLYSAFLLHQSHLLI